MKRAKRRRGVSLGTVFMLSLTAVVLACYFLLLPSFTGHQDIRLDASELAVAIDRSLNQLVASTGAFPGDGPQNTALPPQSLTTVQPAQSAPALAASTPKPAPAIPAVTATPVSKLRFSLCAAGSIQWNSTVRKALVQKGQPAYEILTDAIPGALRADISIATLEQTLIASAKESDINQPSAMLEPLLRAGVNVLNLGHPNILNGGMGGLEETRGAVLASGIQPFGVYASAQERASGTMLEVQGVRVGLLHYQDELSSASRKQTTAEQREAALSPIELSGIARDIAGLRNAGAQVVAVSLCWGKVGASAPTEEQKKLAQDIADAGADLILGSHSGVLQPVQVLSANRGDGKYHPVLCAYSLGNLFSYNRDSRATLASILLKADVVLDLSSGCIAFENLTYTPTYSWRGKQDGRTLQRILLNDGKTYPDFVGKDQKTVMERCYTLVTSVMADTGIPMAE